MSVWVVDIRGTVITQGWRELLEAGILELFTAVYVIGIEGNYANTGVRRLHWSGSIMIKMLKVTKTGAVKCVENKKEIEEMLNLF